MLIAHRTIADAPRLTFSSNAGCCIRMPTRPVTPPPRPRPVIPTRPIRPSRPR